MIRIDKNSYVRGSNVIKSWDVTELLTDEGMPPVNLQQFLADYLGEDHEAVSAAASGNMENPLDEEACETLLKAFDPRAVVEAECERVAQAAAKKAAEKKQEEQARMEAAADRAAAGLDSMEMPREAQQRADGMLAAARDTLARAQAEAEAIRAGAEREAARTLQDAKDRAALTLEAAEAKAERLLSEARVGCAAICEAAKAQGRTAGVEASREEVIGIREAYESRLRDFFEQAQAHNDMRNAEIEKNTLALSVEIAQSILGTALEGDIAPFLGIVKRAVEQLNAKSRFTIRLNKREYERFMEHEDAIRTKLDASFSVICDGSLEPCALLLQGDEGTVDAGVATQLSRVRQVFGMADDAT